MSAAINGSFNLADVRDLAAGTLADDARIGVNEEVRQGFLDWLMRSPS